MKPDKFQGKQWSYLLIEVILILGLFFAVFHFKYPIRYDNMGGDNIWQSASTIKYTNEWLSEGPGKLHFTAYENFDSVEFATLSERVPFISYPYAHTVLVYLAAKLCGRQEIDISFVKHLQMILFAVETLLFAGYLRLLLARFGRTGPGGRMLITVSSTVLWILLPVNAWYLPNVFFTDQTVLLFVMALLYLEELLNVEIHERGSVTDDGGTHSSGRPEPAGKKYYDTVLKVLRVPVIFCGILTDYYFWILVFFVFAARIISGFARREGIRTILRTALSYALPVIAALAVWLIQLSYTEGWPDLLLYKFRFRTGGYEGGVYDRLIENFSSSFTQDQRSFMFWLLLIWLIGGGLTVCYLLGRGRLSLLWTDGSLLLLIVAFLAPAVQILLLKNHSAVHEFSMMKEGFCVAMTAPLLAMVAVRAFRSEGGLFLLGRKIRPFLPTYLLCFFLMLLLTGVPTATSRYIVSRDGDADYTMAEFLRENTGYEDVCFSFTEEIPYEPPHDLTVSHKRVWPVETAEEIDTMFPALPDSAEKLLLVRADRSELPDEIAAAEDALITGAALRAESEAYLLYELP